MSEIFDRLEESKSRPPAPAELQTLHEISFGDHLRFWKKLLPSVRRRILRCFAD